LTHQSLLPSPPKIGPSEYWNCSETRKAQRLYVSFCELAASALDYAEGLRLLRRDERRQGAARLNWAGTAFYYSLVHSARFLIFTAVGDFPTQHNKLAQAFSTSHSGTVSTDWLKSFASNGNVSSAKIGFEHLVDYWSSGVSKEPTAAMFNWFADALARAKALRNENNYEALLIAHEYKHSYLGSSFKRLATTMEGVAKTALAAVVGCYAHLLQPEPLIQPADARTHIGDATASSENGEADDGRWRNVEAAFIRHYVEHRIVQPARSWYGTEAFVVSNAIAVLLAPLRTLQITGEPDLTSLEESMSNNLFAPKTGLMDKFIRKMTELQQALDQAPAVHAANLADTGTEEV